jgi:soluble P-type ATPase
MNWVIFTTECSGKTTFCNRNANKIGKYDLIDYDKITALSDEVVLIDIILELKNKDNQIYLTNIVPPEFILNCNKHFENLSFGIVKIKEEILIENIKNRHNILYNSNYILEYNKKLQNIIQYSKTLMNKILSVNSFDEFKNVLYPPPPPKINLTKRIIRL